MTKKQSVIDLLSKPLWQMSGEEYVALHAYAVKMANDEGGVTKASTRCTGVRELAQFLNCCESTVYAMKREGVLDDSILSSIGKSTVFDGEKAKALAQAYMVTRRQSKNTNTDNE